MHRFAATDAATRNARKCRVTTDQDDWIAATNFNADARAKRGGGKLILTVTIAIASCFKQTIGSTRERRIVFNYLLIWKISKRYSIAPCFLSLTICFLKI